MAEKTAVFVKDLDDFRGNAALYKLSEPLAEYSWDEDEDAKAHEYVIVSAADVPYSGPETYIFPADEDGKIVDWGEMEGSFRGALSHSRALSGAGYRLLDQD